MTATTFAIFLIMVTAVALYVLVRNVRSRTFLMLFIPVALLVSATTVFSVRDLMGKPTEQRPAKEFLFLDVWTDGKHIYIWYLERGRDYPQTFKQPYKRETYQALQQAKVDRAAGKPMIGKPKQGGKPNTGKGDGGPEAEFELYEFKYQQGGFEKDPT